MMFFGLFKRTPNIEWQTEARRRTEILRSLNEGNSSCISLYRLGALQWTRDIARQLHEFTCYPAEQLLTATRESQLALFELPHSFAHALAAKQQWLDGKATEDDIQNALMQLQSEVQHLWPSSFCLGINALVMAVYCFESALDLKQPWKAAHRCAETAAWSLTYQAACKATGCKTLPSSEPEIESASDDEQICTRGIDCPKVVDNRAERTATKVVRGTHADWWQRFNSRLADQLIAEE